VLPWVSAKHVGVTDAVAREPADWRIPQKAVVTLHSPPPPAPGHPCSWRWNRLGLCSSQLLGGLTLSTVFGYTVHCTVQPFSVTQCIAQCNRFRLHSALHSATVFVAQCNRECCKSVRFLNILRFFAIAQCNFFRYTVHRTLSSTVLCTSGHQHTH
jgi:hypothetical protein